ncbi:YbgC/FadM family acyl-CoA thioesterase [Acidocella sp.]|uniref:YbgC/FadM family acyl-CoA thioesterase n=1 Tax=Acidocella sp. TaxID=50710 RepID=UPI0026241788|nr:YbgC/FadM family acyl-CoA thioesterase [Acidocella sp.]
MIYRYTTRIYYQDTDAGGVVYHANYLSIAERARTEALREMGAPHAEMVVRFGVLFVVHRVSLLYQRPARIDELITIETEFSELRGASVTLRQEFLRDNDSLAVLEVGLGCARVSDGRAARIPREWVARLKF